MSKERRVGGRLKFSKGYKPFTEEEIFLQLTMQWKLVVLTIWTFFSSVRAFERYNVRLQFTFMDKDGIDFYDTLAFDPSKSALDVMANNTLVGRYHPNENGVYMMSLVAAETPYKLHFYSKELMFQASSMFQLLLIPQPVMTSLVLGSRNPGSSRGISITNDEISPTLEITLNGPALGVHIANWSRNLAPTSGMGSFTDSIPYLSTIMSNKLLWMPACTLLIIILLPNLIAVLNPSFRDRIEAARDTARKNQ